MSFDAVYYDGRSAARHVVRVEVRGAGLHVNGEGVDFEVPLAAVEVDAPIPGAARCLALPGGAQLRTEDRVAVEALFADRHRLEGWVHGLERRWPWALGAIVVVALFSWWVVVDGLPRAAKLAAHAVPLDVEAALGRQTLAAIDGSFCKASGLEPARAAELQRRFSALTARLDDGYAYRLELRSCRMGPNAFALPGGTVLMTDALVKLAGHDDQLSAVLAHEIGHVRHRHGLRLGLQAAGLAALTAVVLGDLASVANLAVALPTAILQTGYSRTLETEADDYAFQRLKEVGISPRAFADMMRVFQKPREGRPPRGEAADYFSTHPATQSRIERAERAARP